MLEDMKPKQTWDLTVLEQFQEGIVRRSQAMDAGLRPNAIKRRVVSGKWRKVGHGTYATFTGKSTRDAELWTAVLRAGPGAALSHQTAAAIHGFGASTRDEEPAIHITVPAKRHPDRSRALRGVVLHRSRKLTLPWQPPCQLPCTTPADAVLDLVDAAGTFDDAYGWICRALGVQAVSMSTLRMAVGARKRLRWRTWITEALADAGDGVNSPLERRYVQGVERAHGLPAPTRQAKRRAGSRNIYLDNLYEGYRICVELDGAATHPRAGRWKDTDRDNANLASSDIRTFRFGWVAVTENRCRSAAQVAAALRRQGWTGLPRPCSSACPVGRP